MKAEISETIRATMLELGMQISEIPAQRGATPTLTPTNRPQTSKKAILYHPKIEHTAPFATTVRFQT